MRDFRECNLQNVTIPSWCHDSARSKLYSYGFPSLDTPLKVFLLVFSVVITIVGWAVYFHVSIRVWNIILSSKK